MAPAVSRGSLSGLRWCGCSRRGASGLAAFFASVLPDASELNRLVCVHWASNACARVNRRVRARSCSRHTGLPVVLGSDIHSGLIVDPGHIDLEEQRRRGCAWGQREHMARSPTKRESFRGKLEKETLTSWTANYSNAW